MDNVNRTLVSKEICKYEHPSTRDELKTKTHDELLAHLVNIGVPLAQLEAISDEDKRKTYMIDETLRLEKPYPKMLQPVLMDTEIDLSNNKKILTYKYVKHLYSGDKDTRAYKNSEVTIEKYSLPLQVKDIKNYEKTLVMKEIDDEVKSLNLDEYWRKNQILSFGCNNGKSNTEKRRRLIALQKALVNNGFKRQRITTTDIMNYEIY